MATLNIKTKHKRRTHEGAPAYGINAEQQLRRSIMACLLWEDSFYESGESIADRIKHGVASVAPEKCVELVNEARNTMHIRHAPLWVTASMCEYPSHRPFVPQALEATIQRADELAEFATMCRKALNARPVRKALRNCLARFDEYQLAKWRGDRKGFKLRDVLRLIHAKPNSDDQKALWGRVVNDELKTPDTWEVELSKGSDKYASWKRIIAEQRLGGLAILRNLRNMQEAGLDDNTIRRAILDGKYGRVLPFRFIAAARYAPRFEPELEEAMMRCLAEQKRLAGDTAVCVDVSGSMQSIVSNKSDMSRADAASGLAILCRELCPSVRVYAFGTSVAEVAPRRGFALRDAIAQANVGHATNIGDAVRVATSGRPARIIVITDEQSRDRVPAPQGTGYMVNVAAYQNGVGYGPWTHIDGFSEGILRYISEIEVDTA